jgi:hypothetical protein
MTGLDNATIDLAKYLLVDREFPLIYTIEPKL